MRLRKDNVSPTLCWILSPVPLLVNMLNILLQWLSLTVLHQKLCLCSLLSFAYKYDWVLKDYMDYILTSESPPVDSKDRQEIKETEADLSLK